MNVRFTATETVGIAVEEEQVSIQHYLRQPQRLVRAIANPKLMEPLSEHRFRLKMRPINFLDLYHLQPVAVLRVVPDPNGTIYVRSERCEIWGNDFLNDCFSMSLNGHLTPQTEDRQVYLRGRADLAVDVELPPPLWLTPRSLLETTGNGILKGVLQRIKQRLLSQLVYDYRQWARGEEGQASDAIAPSVSPVN